MKKISFQIHNFTKPPTAVILPRRIADRAVLRKKMAAKQNNINNWRSNKNKNVPDRFAQAIKNNRSTTAFFEQAKKYKIGFFLGLKIGNIHKIIK